MGLAAVAAWPAVAQTNYCNATGCVGVYVTGQLGASGNANGDNRPCFFFTVSNTYYAWYAISYGDPGSPYNIGQIKQAKALNAPVSFRTHGGTICGNAMADDFE
jgi:hypothetical protein